jgi:thiamine transporter ThiT
MSFENQYLFILWEKCMHQSGLNQDKRRQLLLLSLASMFIAIGIILPRLTGSNMELNRMLLPMHIPILLCGFVCGYKYGFLAGLLTPILSSLLFGMPMFYPVAINMSIELAIYGLSTGFLYRFLSKNIINLYITLFISLILGRIFYLISGFFLSLISNSNFELISSIVGFSQGFIGVIIQILLIPPLILLMQRNPLLNEYLETK